MWVGKCGCTEMESYILCPKLRPPVLESTVKQQIRNIYAVDSQALPHTSFHLLWAPIDEILQLPAVAKQQWVESVGVARNEKVATCLWCISSQAAVGKLAIAGSSVKTSGDKDRRKQEKREKIYVHRLCIYTDCMLKRNYHHQLWQL